MEESSLVNKLTIDRAKILGTGKYGIVYEGVWGENQVAIKRIPIDNVATSNEREVNALKKFDHENVIKLLHVEEDKDFKCFVLELCKASLDQLFLKENDPKKYSGPVPPEAEVLLQLAKGLEHIHKNELVHRDIKPENVLIWVNPPTNQVLMKWADFGFSKQVNERGTFSMSGVKGTLHWLAPELLALLDEYSSSENEIKKRGTVKSDVFAEGLVFGYFLSKGVHPFGTSSYQIPTNVQKKRPTNLPETKDIRKIIEQMLHKKPENRIASSDVNLLINTREIRTKKMFTLVAKKDPSLEEIKILMREGVDINAKDKKGLTPLLQMAENKKGSGNALEIINLQIQNGANVNSLDSKGKNALLLLCDNHQNHKNENLKEIMGLLMQSGLNVTPETVTFFKEKYQKENRDEILLLLDQQHPDEPETKRMKFE